MRDRLVQFNRLNWNGMSCVGSAALTKKKKETKSDSREVWEAEPHGAGVGTMRVALCQASGGGFGRALE